MIVDTIALQDALDSWRGVEALRGRLQRSLLGSFAQGGTFGIFAADAAYNLPFIHACAVLNDVLEQLRDENHFKCKQRLLGSLLAASQGYVPWLDYPLMEELVHCRNDVAHRGEVLARADCWRYIDAIKAQFEKWQIL